MRNNTLIMLAVGVCLLAAEVASAETTGDLADTKSHTQGTGLGTESQFTCKFAIPKTKEPVFHLPPGHSVRNDSVQVAGPSGTLSPTASDSPNAGEYRVLADGGLFFSPSDAKREVSISYKYSPRRVATLPIVNQSDLPYMSDVTKSAVNEDLAKMGFEVIADADVGASVRAEHISFDPVVTKLGDVPSPDAISKLAARMNAAYILLAVVNAGSQKGSTGYVLGGGGIIIPYESGASSTSGISMLMYDGSTGASLFSKMKTGNKNADWVGKRKARELLTKAIVRGIFVEYYGVDL